MAQSVYTGVMGSGKTYEAVKSVLIPGLRTGRRVVTNITGLQPGRIAELLNKMEKGRPAKRRVWTAEEIDARLTVVDYNRPTEPGFWPQAHDDPDSVIRPGDLVIIDEAWRYVPNGETIDPTIMKYVRMHRQWVDPETKVAGDIVWIIQDISSLHQKIRGITELLWLMKKHRRLGLDNRYVALQYDGKITQKTLVRRFQYKYEKKYFDLYKSYAVEGATEGKSDKRVSLWSDPKIMIGLVVLFLCFGGAIWGIRAIVAKYDKKDAPEVASASSGAPEGSPAAAASPAPVAGAKPASPSGKGRVIGSVGEGADMMVLVERDGVTVLRPANEFVATPTGYIGGSGENTVSSWSAPISPPSSGGVL